MRIHYLQHVSFEGLASIEQWVIRQGNIISVTKFYNGDSFPSVDDLDLPSDAVRLAYSEACANQAFIYVDKVLGLQFHLESTKESVHQIIENCASELVAGKYIQKPEEMLARDDDFRNINTAMCKILEYFATVS